MTSGMAHVGQGCGTECRLGEGQNGWMLHFVDKFQRWWWGQRQIAVINIFVSLASIDLPHVFQFAIVARRAHWNI